METIKQLKEDKSKLIDEILDLVHVLDKKEQEIEFLKKKVSLSQMKFEDKDIEGDLFDRNSWLIDLKLVSLYQRY